MSRSAERSLGVAAAVTQEIAPFIVRAIPLLRSGPFTLWGEVVSIKRGRNLTFLTLVDADDPTLTVDVRVSDEATSVTVGDLVGVSGRLTPTKPDASTIEVVFAGERLVGSRGPSRRQRERHALVARHRRRYGGRRRFWRLRRVLLVTSEQSHAVADFRRALGADLASLAVKLVSVSLQDASSIAEGLSVTRELKPDLVVLTRGGGDPAALLPFREPVVIEAVGHLSSSTPTVVAIGHAADQLELDEIATWAVATPTAAGALVRSLVVDARRRSARLRWFLVILAVAAAAALASKALHPHAIHAPRAQHVIRPAPAQEAYVKRERSRVPSGEQIPGSALLQVVELPGSAHIVLAKSTIRYHA